LKQVIEFSAEIECKESRLMKMQLKLMQDKVGAKSKKTIELLKT
jgi:hypothetical protein